MAARRHRGSVGWLLAADHAGKVGEHDFGERLGSVAAKLMNEVDYVNSRLRVLEGR